MYLTITLFLISILLIITNVEVNLSIPKQYRQNKLVTYFSISIIYLFYLNLHISCRNKFVFIFVYKTNLL